MTHWLLANLNYGKLGQERILDPDAYRLMWAPERELSDEVENCAGISVGIGWFLKHYGGTLMATHSGGDTGFLSDTAILPEKKVAVVWMANCDWIDSGPLNGPITYAALDVALGQKPKPIRVKRSLEKTLHRTFCEEGIEAALSQYDILRKTKPGLFDFGERQLGGLGLRLLSDGHTKEAIRVLQLNVRSHPSSANAYNRLAEANEADGNQSLAITQYKKALGIDPTLAHPVEALKRLSAL